MTSAYGNSCLIYQAPGLGTQKYIAFFTDLVVVLCKCFLITPDCNVSSPNPREDIIPRDRAILTKLSLKL